MAYALEVVKFRDLLHVTQAVRYVPEQAEKTLEVRGDDFRRAATVRINGVVAPSFRVFNKNTLWVVLSDEMGTNLRTIEVDSYDFTRTENASKVVFEIGEQTRRVNGILALLQLYTKWLLQSPGSDIFNPGRGGGLQDLVYRLTSMDKLNPVLSMVTRAVDKTTKQIKTAQSTVDDLPLDERLLDATIADVRKSDERLEIQVRVLVKSVAGGEAVSALIL